MGLIEQLPKATFGPRSEDECVDAEESGGGTIVFDSEGVMKSRERRCNPSVTARRLATWNS